MSRTRTTQRALALGAAAAVMAGGLIAVSPAAAAPPTSDCGRPAISPEHISIQLYSYLSWQSEIGIEGVLDELEDIGYKNVEPFGNPLATNFSSFEGKTALEFKELLHDHGMEAPSRHGNVAEASWATTLQEAKDLEQEFVGSGGFGSPGYSTYENTLATAALMNRLGKRSVAAGVGKYFGHNHAGEFTTKYADPDTGEMKSVWEILVEHTDPRWVTTEVDVYWASVAGVDVPALIEKYEDRIDLLHIKDGFPTAEGTPTSNIRNVGEGDIEWAPILEAAAANVDYYIVERDGAPASREFAETSFRYLTCADATQYVFPEVTTNPSASVAVKIGSSVTLTAEATGTPTPDLQWQVSKNGGSSWSPIEGATSGSYTFTPTKGDSGNRYRAAFTNLAGTTYSAVSKLKVNLLPSTASVALADSSITTKQRAKVAITVRPTGAGTTGTAVLHVGTKTKTVQLTAASKGRVTVTLPTFKKGTYKVWVEYKGNATRAADTSSKITLKVK